MKLTVNGRDSEITAPIELVEQLFDSDGQPYQEIRLEAEDGPSICALLNANRGWLMYLREPGDPGFSSRNPRYSGPPEALLQYRLDNGQMDRYPESWALDISTIRAALLYFEKTLGAAEFVAWNNDSGDGELPPASGV